MTINEREAVRIRAEYERRESNVEPDFYALTSRPNLFIRHGQARALLRGLERASAIPLCDKRILEIGCGRGQWFTVFEDFGATRERLAGIDLSEARVSAARARYGSADLRIGDACELPWPDATFDLVFQSTVFTSILDDRVRAKAASEMRRVLVRDGAILWYDFRLNNPSNSQVRGISSREIAKLFPGYSLDMESVTLAPPIARRLVPRSWILAAGLQALRVFNTHLFAVIRP